MIANESEKKYETTAKLPKGVETDFAITLGKVEKARPTAVVQGHGARKQRLPCSCHLDAILLGEVKKALFAITKGSILGVVTLRVTKSRFFSNFTSHYAYLIYSLLYIFWGDGGECREGVGG